MKNIKLEFDFDDILIVPSISTDITSRYHDIILPKILPLFTAPMDTVVNLDNFESFLNNGINIALPRTIKYDKYNYYTNYLHIIEHPKIFISLGFEDIDKFIIKNPAYFLAYHENANILIDVANGHMQKIVDYANEIKRLRPDIKIMVGNIANTETYK